MIPNDQLRPSDVPGDAASWEEIQWFALMFDGYKYWGSAERCAEVAKARPGSTLTELRTCLFYEQRRWWGVREGPDPEAMAYIRELVRRIRALVSDGPVPESETA